MARQEVTESGVREWLIFKEVKQNWLGFTFLGNGGRGLGPKFARSMLNNIDRGIRAGGEAIHLESAGLFADGVGRDGISDFTTNLTKEFLARYTERFAVDHIDQASLRKIAVPRARFDYEAEVWRSASFTLPYYNGDFILLSPMDILTKDDTWINRDDLVANLTHIVNAHADEDLRARVNIYIAKQLSRAPSAPGKAPPPPTAREREVAAIAAVREFPELIDLYIKMKESLGDAAQAGSIDKVLEIQSIFVNQVSRAVRELNDRTPFYRVTPSSYQEALNRVLAFKQYVENQDGYKLINRRGKPFSSEDEVQLFFGLIWFDSPFDVNREPNNGRGPVDSKISYGRGDKALVELKLASSTSLERNLRNQVQIYQAANQTDQAIKVIVSYTEKDERRARSILKKLKLDGTENVILVDARNDNKPSASKA